MSIETHVHASEGEKSGQLEALNALIDAGRLLTEDEAASRLKISRSWLQKRRMTGDGPPFFRLGLRRVVYRAGDLDVWVDTQRRISTSAA